MTERAHLSPRFLDRDALRALGEARRTEYGAATPFPHAFFDDFLGRDRALAVAHAFPDAGHPDWMRRDYSEQKRLGQLQRTAFRAAGTPLRELLLELTGMGFLDFLEALTGREALIADPHYMGAGPSLTESGGHLALHADFNRDRRRHLARVVTVLYYATPDFDPVWGGALALADREGAIVTRIAPRFDRLLVMDHGDHYFHGHPEPLGTPAGIARASIAAYYYVADAVDGAASAHGAIWLERRSSSMRPRRGD